ncbi:epidermal growth factor-like protein 7 [Eublepharis macularius]|uniref:Epidermal growth factor-like protein 7 n=1 Tax=Eublepharis macularius TaxID=481883 RepID=A0AA97LFK4_EUBMA|nr:epidermal growth factor-like protein 7 [Eublepharis macularius]XP_054853396.1 epidermal growth factor-like protein 7 [Eublepharis macularius]
MLHWRWGGESPNRGEEMRRDSCLLVGCLLMLALTDADHSFLPGRRVCSAEVQSRTVSFLVSSVHPVYQPYLTMCQGQRVCSTYSTTYKVSRRWAYQTVSQLAYRCCPGWRWVNGHSWRGCNAAICHPPCQNGGKCLFPNECACPAGWTGRCCQTDVDECAGGRHGCSQACSNVAGSYSCRCQQGHMLRADGKTCQAPEAPTDAPGVTSLAGASDLTVQKDVEELRSRVLALEEKLQLALAPLLKLELPGLESVSASPLGLILHVWQQLDRIDSLSEQISFLEEQLETCTCQPELGGRRRKKSPTF